MSGWIRDERWWGIPMRCYRVTGKTLKENNISPSMVMRDNPDNNAELIKSLTLIWELPSDATLIGVKRPVNYDALDFIYVSHEFPRVDEGAEIPVVVVESK